MASIGDVIRKINSAKGIIDDIKDIVNDLPADLQAAREKILDILHNVEDVPSNFRQIFRDVATAVSDIGTAISNIDSLGSDLFRGGLGTKLKLALQGFFNACDDILSVPIQKLLDRTELVKDFLTSVFKLLGEAFAEVFKAFIEAIASAGDELGDACRDLYEEIADLCRKVVQKLIDGFTSAMGSVVDFPSALRTGPLSACNGVADLIRLQNTLGSSRDLTDRLNVVESSVSALVSQVGGSAGLEALSGTVESVTSLIRALQRDVNNPQRALEGFLKDIVFPTRGISAFLTAAARGQIGKWAEMPSGFTIGGIHGWLNDPSTYDATVPFQLERRYRMRLAGSIEAYFRDHEGAQDSALSIGGQDQRRSDTVASDLVSAFVTTTMSFIFEPEGYPEDLKGLTQFEELGEGCAKVLGRQMKAAIRSAIGLILRGFWVFSVQNVALIELIASAIGSFFGAIIEGIVRNLTWTFKIMSTYEGESLGSNVPSMVVDSALKTVDNGVRVKYLVVNRADRSRRISIPSFAAGLLKDYCAYLDMCFERFPMGSRFGDVDDTRPGRVDVTYSADLLDMTVEYNPRNPGPYLAPVARMYLGGVPYVLEPDRSSGPIKYFATIPVPLFVVGSTRIIVLTSDGVITKERFTGP